MKNYRMLVAHFSPTGTTLKIARSIAQSIGFPIHEIDLSTPIEVLSAQDGDILLAAMPVYGGRVPAIALERLSQINGMGQPAVAIVAYGNRAYDDALLELKEALEANGFKPFAAGAFIAEHSIVRSIAQNRPNEVDLDCAKSLGSQIVQFLKQDSIIGSITVPGNHPYREYKGLSFHPKAGKACVGCGQCAKLCPISAIPEESPSDTDTSKCITCMRCVSVCPSKARALPVPALLAASSMLKMSASTPKAPEIFLP